MVVSSGMQSMETMRRVYKTVKEHNQNFAILQCTSAYPLEAEDVNLRVIAVRKRNRFQILLQKGAGAKALLSASWRCAFSKVIS